ncbi:MAG: NADH-quinone oxidoreductase subunit L, partial [Pseudonocardia sp.]
AAVVSAVYSAKAVWWVWQPVPSERAVRRNRVGRVPALMVPVPMAVPLVGLALLAATLGVLPIVTSGSLEVAPAPAMWELLLSAVLATAAVAVTWRVTYRIGEPVPLVSWLELERAARAVLVRPTLVVARVLARFDDRVLDRFVDATARGVGSAARVLDRRGELSVDGAVRAVAAGARSLGRLARRPQTGQLHQYYAQAAVVLAALALFMIVVR